MSRSGLPHDAVFYPSSDGRPMAETPIHGDCMMYVTYALRRCFHKRGREDVYVGMNNFLYYERGNPGRWWRLTCTWWWARRHSPLATRTCCGTSRRGRTSCWR